MRIRFNTLSTCELVGIVVFTVLAIVFGISAYKRMMVNINYNDALMRYGSRDQGAAVEKLIFAVDMYPSYPYPRELLAKIYVDANNFELAERHYEALEQWTKGKSISPFIGRAVIRIRKADRQTDENLKAQLLAEARELYERALQIAPESPEAQIGLGFIALRKKEFSSAKVFFENAYKSNMPLSVDGLVDLHLGRGFYYYKGPARDPSAALSEIRKAFQLRPTWKSTLLNIGCLYADLLIDPDLTREAFDSHLREIELYKQNISQLVLDLSERQVVNEFLAILNNALGIAYTRFKEWERARDSFDRAISKVKEIHMFPEGRMQSDPSAPFINKANLWMERSRDKLISPIERESFHSKASSCLDEALKFVRDEKLRYILLNNVAVIEHKYNPEKAVRYLNEAISLDDSNYLAYKNLGIVQDINRRPVDAITNYKKSLLIKPDQPDIVRRVNDLRGVREDEDEEDW